MDKKNRKISLDRIIKELNEFIDDVESSTEGEKLLSEEELKRLESIKHEFSRKLISIIEKQIPKPKKSAAQQLAKIKEIILNVEILPFQLATRSTDVLQHGALWRHDGNPVRFKIQVPHDKLEIYSPRGEFITSFPISRDGKVEVNDLEAGVYCLYLRGRRVVGME